MLSGRTTPRTSLALSATAISISSRVVRCWPLASRSNGSHVQTESKYSHAAVWGFSGFVRPDGSRSYPLTAMVANLAKPTPGKPALMRHDDVVTFFHEMGHVFHGLLSRTQFARFHGTS